MLKIFIFFSVLTPISDEPADEEKIDRLDKIRHRSCSYVHIATSAPKINLPETKALELLTKSSEHKYLLKHPLLTSFLWLKWERIYQMYNMNLRFQVLFVFMLTWVVYEKTAGNFVNDQNCNGIPNISTDDTFSDMFYAAYFILVFIQMLYIIKDLCTCILGGKTYGYWILLEILWLSCCTILIIVYKHIKWNLHVILIAYTILLILKEAFQIMLSLTKYLFKKKNWIDILLIGLVYFIMFHDDNCEDSYVKLKRILGSFIIVISWTDLFCAIGKHPYFTR